MWWLAVNSDMAAATAKPAGEDAMAKSESVRVERIGRESGRNIVQRWLLYAATLVRMVKDPGYRFPRKLLVMMAIAVLYFVSPIDLIPDFLIPLGFLDDIGLLTATGAMLMSEARQYAERRGF